jgi:hypothetical protein
MGERRGVYWVLVRKPEVRRPLRKLGVDGKVILKRIFEMWGGSMDWIDLAQDRDRLQAVVNAVTNLRVLKARGGGGVS